MATGQAIGFGLVPNQAVAGPGAFQANGAPAYGAIPTGTAPGQVKNLQILFQGMNTAGQGTNPNAPIPTNPSTQAIGWTQATAGAYPITQNNIYRNANGAGFVLYATISAATSFTDTAATNCVGSSATPHNAQGQNWPANGYLYKVSAVDSQGNEGPQSGAQIFVLYKNGSKLGFGGDYNNVVTSNYTDTTGSPPFGDTEDVLNTTNGTEGGQWLPYAGNNASLWNIWCGYGSPAQVFAYLYLTIKASRAGQTFNMWVEYRTDSNGDPSAQPGITGVGNAAATYGNQLTPNTWTTFRLPLSLLMVCQPSDGNFVEGMFYKLGMSDALNINGNQWWVDNVYLSVT